jgi:hypothetical protein
MEFAGNSSTSIRGDVDHPALSDFGTSVNPVAIVMP